MNAENRMYLSVDGFDPYPEVRYEKGWLETSSFPSGCEEYVRVTAHFYQEVTYCVCMRIHSSADIMRLFMITDAVRRYGVKRVGVFIPYLPYARQDRVCMVGESLSASVMANLLNAQQYEFVMAYDPHSDVMPALINNFVTINPVGHLMQALKDYPDAVLCSPDAGAVKRVEKLAHMVGYTGQIAMALKARTGDGVSTSTFIGDVSDKDVIIVDDICDGGATFLSLAERLKLEGAAHVVLCVTHGLFTKGADRLFDNGIDAIYCTDSFVKETDPRIKRFAQ